jgi:hypothetical protein
LHGIQQQVDERVLQLGFVRADVYARRDGRRFDPDRLGARRGVDQARNSGDGGGDVHDVALRALAARHAQKMLRDRPAAQDLFTRDGCALPDALVVRLAVPAGRVLAQDALHAGEHRGQRRIQLVGEAGCQSSQ